MGASALPSPRIPRGAVLPWYLSLALKTPAAPGGNAADSAVTYILNYGILGIVALALVFRWLVPRGAVEEAREQGRADVIAERDRAIARADKAEGRADKAEADLKDALKFTAERTAPMLEQFVSATGTLIPILQSLVHYGLPAAARERDPGDDWRRGRDQQRGGGDGGPRAP